MFSREVILALKPLDAPNFQSLLNYGSSRALACATTLALRMSMMEPEAVDAMAAAVATEIATADSLTGIGFMMHGDKLYAPMFLRALTPLMVEDRLKDFDALKVAVSAKGDGSEGLLPYYSGNWWNEFNKDNLQLPQAAADVIRFWKQQKPHLRLPVSLPPLGELNVAGLTVLELHQAYMVADDAVKMLEKDTDRCLQHATKLAQSIKYAERMKRDLKSLEDTELAKIAARDIADAMQGGSGPSGATQGPA